MPRMPATLSTAEAAPYALTANLSSRAKEALDKEQARRRLQGKRINKQDLASEILEKALLALDAPAEGK